MYSLFCLFLKLVQINFIFTDNAQGLVTIQVNILSMYKRICLYIDSIFTWIVTRPCARTQYSLSISWRYQRTLLFKQKNTNGNRCPNLQVLRMYTDSCGTVALYGPFFFFWRTIIKNLKATVPQLYTDGKNDRGSRVS